MVVVNNYYQVIYVGVSRALWLQVAVGCCGMETYNGIATTNYTPTTPVGNRKSFITLNIEPTGLFMIVIAVVVVVCRGEDGVVRESFSWKMEDKVQGMMTRWDYDDVHGYGGVSGLRTGVEY